MTLEKTYNGKSVDEVVDLLHNYGQEAKLIAGGTDLVIAMRNGRLAPRLLIDISKIEELKEIKEEKDQIILGGGVSFSQVVESQLFQKNLYGFYKACKMVGSPQIRNKGSLAGNIINGSSAADGVPPLIALGARLVLVSKKGRRELEIEEFYKSGIGSRELLTEIKFNKPNNNQILSFAKLGLRKALAISRLTLSSLIEFDEEDRIKSLVLASGAIGKYPMREVETEEYLKNKLINEESIEGAIEDLRQSMDRRLEGRSSLAYKRMAIDSILRELLETSIDHRMGC